MAQTKTQAGSRKSGIRPSTIVLVSWIAFCVYLYQKNRVILYGLPLVVSSNLLETLWNIFFAFIGCLAVIRIWLKPVWRFVFQDTAKVGQKLEWYSETYQHLTPENRAAFWTRYLTILVSAGFLFTICSVVDIPWLRYQHLIAQDIATANIKEYFGQVHWTIAREFALFSSFFYFFLMFEGRSRILLRIISHYQKKAASKKYLEPLPDIPFDHKSDELEITMFTAFIETKEPSDPLSETKKLSLKQTSREEWFTLKEKGLRTNSLVVAPSGSGKTVAMVKNTLTQAIFWQYDDPAKKASMIIYDPKAELTKVVQDVASKANRSDDLIIFSLSEDNCLNPIKVDNPWSGETSWKVAGWIVGSWQNYQGKSSPEPYWESQNYILTRNLLVLEYLFKGSYVTISDIASAINTAGDGCFRRTPEDRFITAMGERTLTVFAAFNDDDYLRTYINYKFDHVDYKRITSHIRALTSERKMAEVGRFAKIREELHVENDKKLEALAATISGPSQDLAKKAQKQYDERLKNLINSDLIKKFGAEFEPSDDDCMHTVILSEAEDLKNRLIKDYPDYLHVIDILNGACDWLIKTWSSNAADNRGSVVTNMMPFLQQFQTPELKRIFSPGRNEETTDFDKAVAEGKIIVPDFAGIKIGNGIANGIITLIKSRWQNSVLMGDDMTRLKIQIMDEAQRIMTIGDGNTNVGDFDYCELSRSFGGITWFLSQSVAALRAKANRDVEWEKIHGVVRSIYCLSTNDGATIKFMQDIAGETSTTRVSKTVSETANSPGMDMIAEKFRGDQGTLGISYSESPTLEKKIQAEDIQDADAYTALATVYDGRKNHLMRIAIRPSFWPEKRDSYELMQKCDFKPENRQKFTKKRYKDSISKLIKRAQKKPALLLLTAPKPLKLKSGERILALPPPKDKGDENEI